MTQEEAGRPLPPTTYAALMTQLPLQVATSNPVSMMEVQCNNKRT